MKTTPAEPREPEKRGGGWLAAAALAALALSAGGALLWQLRARDPGLDTDGFDMASAPKTRTDSPSAAPAPAGRTGPDGTLMVKSGGALGPAAAPPAAPAPAAAPAAEPEPGAPRPLDLKDAARRYEGSVRDFGRRMEKRYPSLTQYARDWNSHPELRALKDQYWRDRDPIRFAYGLAQSENFPKLVKKYAADPGVRAFLTEGVKQAPVELLAAAAGAFRTDYTIRTLVGHVTKEVGVAEDADKALKKPAAAPARKP